MKAFKITCVAALLIGLAFLMNSCSSTQQFAGTCPKNNITGKGFGYGVTDKKTQPDYSNAVASAEPKSITVNDVKPAVLTETPVDAPVAVATKHKLGAKIQTRLTKYVLNFWAKHPISAEGSVGSKETLGNKVYSKLMRKYGISNEDISMAANGGGGLAGASRILAIVSLATGCAASLWYAGFFFGPAAIVTGVLALVGIKQGGDGRKLFAILGIAFGAFFLFLWILFAAILFRGGLFL